jgi:hypothetical protein
LIVRQHSGSFVVVDLDAPQKELAPFASVEGANLLLRFEGLRPVRESDLVSFDAIYREYGPQTPHAKFALIGAAVAVWVAGLLLWVWRRPGSSTGSIDPPGSNTTRRVGGP